jgi:hypothetical protein
VTSSRAPRVGQFDDVRGTSDVSIVLLDAATQTHPTVTGVSHEDDRTDVAAGVEGLRLAVEAAVFGSCTEQTKKRRVDLAGIY